MCADWVGAPPTPIPPELSLYSEPSLKQRQQLSSYNQNKATSDEKTSTIDEKKGTSQPSVIDVTGHVVATGATLLLQRKDGVGTENSLQQRQHMVGTQTAQISQVSNEQMRSDPQYSSCRCCGAISHDQWISDPQLSRGMACLTKMHNDFWRKDDFNLAAYRAAKAAADQAAADEANSCCF